MAEEEEPDIGDVLAMLVLTAPAVPVKLKLSGVKSTGKNNYLCVDISICTSMNSTDVSFSE